MTTLYANPYGYGLKGFYFEDVDDYEEKLEKAQQRDPSGDFEHSIEFIDGDSYELFKAMRVGPWNVEDFFELEEEFGPEETVAFIYLTDYAGYEPDEAAERVENLYVYEGTLRQYVQEQADDMGVLEAWGDTHMDWEAYGRRMGGIYGTDDGLTNRDRGLEHADEATEQDYEEFFDPDSVVIDLETGSEAIEMKFNGKVYALTNLLGV